MSVQVRCGARGGRLSVLTRLHSLSLINSLLRHVTDNLFDAFTAELERLGVSKAVAVSAMDQRFAGSMLI